MQNNIRKWRHKRGITIEQLADMIHCSHGQLSKLERGERRLDTDWLERISKALNCAPLDLITDKEHSEKMPAPKLEEIPEDVRFNTQEMVRQTMILEGFENPHPMEVREIYEEVMLFANLKGYKHIYPSLVRYVIEVRRAEEKSGNK